MTSKEARCPKCGLATASGDRPTITQWLSGCRCAVVQSGAIDDDTASRFCTQCGKRIAASRSGSLTQWIFGSDMCTCQKPVPGEARKTQAAQKEIVPDNEPELNLDAETFPSDRYKPLAEIGRGASGIVYLCRDRLLGKKVAIKCLHSVTGEHLIAFQNEARATSQLSHPGVIQVMDFGSTASGAPYMVMEYISGTCLEDVIKQEGALEIDTCLHIFAETARALAYAHDKGFFHRDMKSSNILLLNAESRMPDVKLIDFGVAGVKHATQEPTILHGRTIVGTPLYMPPDQAQGLPYSEQSEIYAVGCVFFEALTGRPPFLGESALETIGMHAQQPAPTLEEVRGDLSFSQGLEEIIATCLAKEPKKRFASMKALAEAIESINPSGDDLSTDTIYGDTGTPTANWKLIVTAAAALVLIGAGGYGLWQTILPKETPPTQLYQTSMPNLLIVDDMQNDAELARLDNASNAALEKVGEGDEIYSKHDELAKQLIQKRKYDEAIKVLEGPKQIGYTPALDTRGLAYLLKGDLENAANDLSRYNKRAPLEASGQAHFHYGLVQVARDQVDAAKMSFAYAITRGYEPTDWETKTFRDGMKVWKLATEEYLQTFKFQILDADNENLAALKGSTQRHLILSGGKYNAEGLKQLSGLPLEEITFSICPVKDKDFEVLDLPKLKRIEFATSAVNGACLKYLARSPLEHIVFSSTDLEDQFLIYLRPLKSLKSLSIIGCPKFTGSGFAYISPMKDIALNWGTMKDGDLLYGYPPDPIGKVAKLRGLQHLSLMADALSAEDFAKLPQLRIVMLRLIGGLRPLSKEEFTSIARIPNLLTLHFDKVPLSRSDSVRELAKCKSLAALHLVGTQMTDQALEKNIVPLKLHILELDEPYLTRKSLSALAKMQSLNVLSFFVLPIGTTKEDIQHLHKRLPNCVINKINRDTSALTKI